MSDAYTKANVTRDKNGNTDIDGAITCLKQSLEIKDDPNIWYQLGGLYSIKKDTAAAEDAYRRSGMPPPNPPADLTDNHKDKS